MKISSEEIINHLNNLYPYAHCELFHRNNFELLICVILSAQTTDKNVNKYAPILFGKYNDAYMLANADLSDIESIIKPIGLYKNKALNIYKTAKMLIEEYNGEVPNGYEELLRLPGVGIKTANIIMNNCFNTPAFAVDTHVARVSKRLGIAKQKDNVNIIEKKLMKFFPKELWGKLHHQFIFFGRYKCKSIKPNCSDCPFNGRCYL